MAEIPFPPLLFSGSAPKVPFILSPSGQRVQTAAFQKRFEACSAEMISRDEGERGRERERVAYGKDYFNLSKHAFRENVIQSGPSGLVSEVHTSITHSN